MSNLSLFELIFHRKNILYKILTKWFNHVGRKLDYLNEIELSTRVIVLMSCGYCSVTRYNVRYSSFYPII